MTPLVGLLLLVQAQASGPLAAVSDSVRAGRVDAAIDLAQHYVWKHRGDPAGYLALGDAWASKKPMGGLQALQQYRQARDLEPKDPDPPYRMAQLALRLGGADGERILRESLERVMSLDPLYKNAWQQWLLAYRNTDGRKEMINRLRPFAANPTVMARLAQLDIEGEAYAAADSLLAGAIAADSTNPQWLALRAQSSLERGDTVIGFATYERALAHANRDTSNALWSQIVGIVTPAEYVAWTKGVPPGEKGSWIESFWARRNPDLFAGVNLRVLEHFQRLRYARAHFPFLHPFTSAQRNVAARGANLEPSAGERTEYVTCEAQEGVTNGSVMDVTARWLTDPFLKAGGIRGITEDAPIAAGSVTDLATVFQDNVFAPLNMDLRGVDPVAARLGYDLETGLDDRGVMYLRFGPPRRAIIGNTNLGHYANECFHPDIERWQYDGLGEVRFAPARGDETFRPMNAEQYGAMQKAMIRDASGVPAPLQFGVWFSQFRDSLNPRLTDLVVVTTRGEVAATLVGTEGGDRGVRSSPSGHVTIHDRPGAYALLTDARDADTLGRQSFGATLRSWDSLPAVSDLLLDDVWSGDATGRQAALEHVRRDLTFLSGNVVRTYAELYGLSPRDGVVRYHASYQLLKTGNVSRDVSRTDWPDAVKFDFDRQVSGNVSAFIPEVLDIDPHRLAAGRYLLRLVVSDETGRTVGRSTVSFQVR